MKLDFRQRLLATTLMVSASMLASPAFAQDTPPDAPAQGTPPDISGPVEAQPPAAMEEQPAQEAPQPEEPGRDIVVTGTRIPSANIESAAPVTVVSSQDFKLSGTSRVEDVLNSLPSVGASMTSTIPMVRLARPKSLFATPAQSVPYSVTAPHVPGDPRHPDQAADLLHSVVADQGVAEVLTGGASSCTV